MTANLLETDASLQRQGKWPRLAFFSGKKWMTRCSAPDCPLGGRNLPAALIRFLGIFYGERWYHQAACLPGALTTQLERLFAPPVERKKHHRLPFGLLLVKRGAITPGELRDALERQRQA